MKVALVLLATACCVANACAQSRYDGTPCLEEYRTWYLSRTDPYAVFDPSTTQWSAAQCEQAKLAHDKIIDADLAEDAARLSLEESREAARKRALAVAELEWQRKRAEADRRHHQMRAEQLRSEAKRRAERAALAKRPGVRIGMTPDDVRLRSSWGIPQAVHRTTTASGAREQWVYGNGHYLYFDDGVLSAIQD